MACYSNLPRMVYGMKLAEFLEKNGIKIDKYAERLIDEILDYFFVCTSPKIEAIYKKLKEELRES